MSFGIETVIVAELERAVRTRNYAKLSLLALVATLISAIVFFGSEIKAPPPPDAYEFPVPTPTIGAPSPPDVEASQAAPIDIPLTALLVSAGVFIFGSIGTASGVILGWRKESREAEEHRLKIEKLELELAEARRKLGEA